MAVPPRAEIFAKTLQAQQATQRMKMFSDARARVVNRGLLDEFTPGFVREEGKRTKFAAFFKVRQDLVHYALLIFARHAFGNFRPILHERFLAVGRFAVNQQHEAD